MVACSAFGGSFALLPVSSRFLLVGVSFARRGVVRELSKPFCVSARCVSASAPRIFSAASGKPAAAFSCVSRPTTGRFSASACAAVQVRLTASVL